MDFCLFPPRCARYHLHKQMALEESVSKELCWLWIWQKSQCRNLSSNITLQMLSFTHHQFPLSRKASLMIARSMGKGHHDTWVSQAENLLNINTATETYIDPEALVAACKVMLHNSPGPRQPRIVPAEGRARGKAPLDFSWSFKNGHQNVSVFNSNIFSEVTKHLDLWKLNTTLYQNPGISILSPFLVYH